MFLLNLLQYCFGFMIWLFGREAYGILASKTGIESVSPCIGKHSLNPWTTRKSPYWLIYWTKMIKDGR